MKAAQAQPGQSASLSAVTIYNVFLRTVKHRWQNDAALQTTPEAASGVSIEDLAAAAARLAQVLDAAWQALPEAEREQSW